MASGSAGSTAAASSASVGALSTPPADRPGLGPRLNSVTFGALPTPPAEHKPGMGARTHSSAYAPAATRMTTDAAASSSHSSSGGSTSSFSPGGASDPWEADRRLEMLTVRAQHVRQLLAKGKHQTTPLVFHHGVHLLGQSVAAALEELEELLRWRLTQPLTPIGTNASHESAHKVAVMSEADAAALEARERRCRDLLHDMEGWMLVEEGCQRLGLPLVRARLSEEQALDLLRTADAELKGLVAAMRELERKEVATTVWGRLRAWTMPLFRRRKGKRQGLGSRSKTW